MRSEKLSRRLPKLEELAPECMSALIIAGSGMVLLCQMCEVAALPLPAFLLQPGRAEAAALYFVAGVNALLLLRRKGGWMLWPSALVLLASSLNVIAANLLHGEDCLRVIHSWLRGVRLDGQSPAISTTTGFALCAWSFGFLLLLGPRTNALQRFCAAVSATLVLSLGVLGLLENCFGVGQLSWKTSVTHMTQVSSESAMLLCLLGLTLAGAAKRQMKREQPAEKSSAVVISNHLLVSLTLLLLFTAVNAVLNLGLDESARQRAEIAQSYQISKAIEEALEGLRQAESGQRGYLLTGKELFLEGYWAGLDRSAKAQSALNWESTEVSLAAFSDVIRAKALELAETIRLQEIGRSDEAKAFIAAGAGVALMKQVEEQTQIHRLELSSIITRQTAAYKSVTELVRRSILTSYAVAICLLGCAALFFKREIEARTVVEEKLRQHEAELALGVEKRTRELMASEARYQALLDQSPLAVHVLDREGNSLHVNAAFERMVGVPAGAMQNYNIWTDPQPDAQGTRELLRRAFRGETGLTGTVRHVPKLSSGTPLGTESERAIWAEVIVYPVRSLAGRIEEVVLLCHDVTDRETALVDLRESERKFRQLANVLPQVVWTARPDGVLNYYNDRWWALTRSSPEDGMGWESVVHPNDLEDCVAAWEYSVKTAVPFELELRLQEGQTGEYRWFLGRALPVFDDDGRLEHWVGTTTDIQDQKAAEEELERRVSARTAELQKTNRLLQSREDELRRSLGERDVLFREVHHRVKNNLQVISSLLRMKGEALKHDRAAFVALEESRRRVLSMSMIHERLYMKSSENTLDFADYTRRLVDELIYSYSLPDCKVTSRVQVQTVELPVDQAIPCGLILNELVTNALKYAFVGRRCGLIGVILRRQADVICLSVTDDGVGLPASLDWRNASSLGLPIVNILARQLDGSVEYAGDRGSTFTVQFRTIKQA